MGTLRWTDTDQEDYDCRKQKKNTEENYQIHAKICDKRSGQRIILRSKHPEN